MTAQRLLSGMPTWELTGANSAATAAGVIWNFIGVRRAALLRPRGDVSPSVTALLAVCESLLSLTLTAPLSVPVWIVVALLA